MSPEDRGSRSDSGTEESGHERSSSSPPSGHFYRAAWSFYLVLAIVGILWMGFSAGDLRLSFFFDLDLWWQDLLIGVGAGVGLILGWSLLRDHVEAMQRIEAEMREMIGDLETGEVWALALMSGFAEELFFRGAMQLSWGWPIALIIFGLLHTGPGPAFRIWTLFALVAGGLFAGLTLWRGNLLAPIVAHIVVNGVNMRRLVGNPQGRTATKS